MLRKMICVIRREKKQNIVEHRKILKKYHIFGVLRMIT